MRTTINFKSFINTGLVLTCLCATQSCSKSTQLGASDNNIEPQAVLSVSISELEAQGELHNSAMDYIGGLDGFASFSDETLFGHIQDYYSEAVPGFDFEQENINHYGLLEQDQTFVDIAEQLDFTENGVSLMEDLQSNMTYICTTEGLSIAEVNSLLLSFEDDVTNAGLPESEQDFILGTAVIGRYSANYWYGVASNVDHDWYGVISNDNANIASSAAVPQFISDMAQDNVDVQLALPSVRTIVDCVAYALSMQETEGGMFDEAFRRQVASNDATFYSANGF